MTTPLGLVHLVLLAAQLASIAYSLRRSRAYRRATDQLAAHAAEVAAAGYQVVDAALRVHGGHVQVYCQLCDTALMITEPGTIGPAVAHHVEDDCPGHTGQRRRP